MYDCCCNAHGNHSVQTHQNPHTLKEWKKIATNHLKVSQISFKKEVCFMLLRQTVNANKLHKLQISKLSIFYEFLNCSILILWGWKLHPLHLSSCLSTVPCLWDNCLSYTVVVLLSLSLRQWHASRLHGKPYSFQRCLWPACLFWYLTHISAALFWSRPRQGKAPRS